MLTGNRELVVSICAANWIESFAIK